MRVISTANEWKQLLRKFQSYDFYHTFDYHEIESKLRNHQSRPIMLVHECEEGVVALPLLLNTKNFS